MVSKELDKAIEKAGKSLIYLQDTLEKMPFDFLAGGDDIQADIKDLDSMIDRLVALMEDMEDKVEDGDATDMNDAEAQDLMQQIEKKFQTAIKLMEETNKDLIKGTEDANPASSQLTQVENVHWYYKQAITQLEDSYAHYQTAQNENFFH